MNYMYLQEGNHIVTDDHPYVLIDEPMTITGAGRKKTYVKGGGFQIFGKREDGEVILTDMTVCNAKMNGLHGLRGVHFLSFHCIRMHFDLCNNYAVVAYGGTSGRLSNCQVTRSKKSGVVVSCGDGNDGDSNSSGTYSRSNRSSSTKDGSTIDIEGEETKIEMNNTRVSAKETRTEAAAKKLGMHLSTDVHVNYVNFGLKAATPNSSIHLVFPLTKESITAGGNYGGRNWGGSGTIQDGARDSRKEVIARWLGVKTADEVVSYMYSFCCR